MTSLALPEERVFVKHNFVVDVTPQLIREPQHLVTYVGRLDAAKGIPLLMTSWDHFRARNPGSPLRLVLAGSGPLEAQVRAWADRHPSVDVLGLLPREEVVQLVSHSLAALVPSQWEETFGLVAVESMAASVPPVAPARGSFPELIQDGVDGFLFRPGSPESLASILERVDRHPERFVDAGRRSRSTYSARFGPQANVEELLKIYRFAIANPASESAIRP